MAEPFGIAASVVSILSLAIQLSSAVHEILKPYRSASKDIKQLEADLEAMKRTASQISNKISSNRVPDDPQWDGESLHQLLENAYVRADELRNQMEFRSKNPRTYNIGRHHGSKLGIYNIGRPRGRDKGRCTEILEVNNTFSGIFMGFSALVLCATTALWKPSNIMQKITKRLDFLVPTAIRSLFVSTNHIRSTAAITTLFVIVTALYSMRMVQFVSGLIQRKSQLPVSIAFLGILISLIVWGGVGVTSEEEFLVVLPVTSTLVQLAVFFVPDTTTSLAEGKIISPRNVQMQVTSEKSAEERLEDGQIHVSYKRSAEKPFFRLQKSEVDSKKTPIHLFPAHNQNAEATLACPSIRFELRTCD